MNLQYSFLVPLTEYHYRKEFPSEIFMNLWPWQLHYLIVLELEM